MCQEHSQEQMNHNVLTRRELMKKSAIVSAGLLFGNTTFVYAGENPHRHVLTRGYAAFDESGILKAWEFERRPVGDDDVLIEIKAASICHSDIHQMKGHWGPQHYPQVPGHEIAGIVSAVGKNVTQFKVGDKAGVGCMVNSNPECESFKKGEEQYCPETTFTYGFPEKDSPTGISQGGYSTNIVVNEHFVVKIPENISFEHAAPLLCAGITTYSPLMKFDLKKGDKVGVAGVGGLGHLAVKIAVSKGAEVYAFTTSQDKVKDILSFGAKQAIFVKDASDLAAHSAKLDYMISTIPYQHDIGAYIATVKPYGFFTYVGMPDRFEIMMNNLGLSASRVNFNSSLIGGMRETQEVVNYCAEHKLYPQIEVISAEQINQAWANVVDKKARYRYVIDTQTI